MNHCLRCLEVRKAFVISWKEKVGITKGDLDDWKAWVVEPVDL